MRHWIIFRVMDPVRIRQVGLCKAPTEIAVDISLRDKTSAVLALVIGCHHVNFLLYFSAILLQFESTVVHMPSGVVYVAFPVSNFLVQV